MENGLEGELEDDLGCGKYDYQNKILPAVREWQARPLASVYAVVYLHALHFKRSGGRTNVKKTVYIAIGLDIDGRRDVLGMYIGENKSAKFWMTVLNN